MSVVGSASPTTLVVLATWSASRPVASPVPSHSAVVYLIFTTEVECHHSAAEEVAQTARCQPCWIFW
ncbi:hypothetical protein Taro_028652 [Colocasia esculenta]|uniref:Uncharacterized protein n=1 Tax=Colocasia esculenta TaxID=4460 RepID=A0A843VNR1_COLES|nr:hypothetical protein [Colocasia esculenta]